MIGRIKKIPQFFKEIAEELKKVSWSSKNELRGALIVVISMLAALTTYFFVIDLGLSRLIHSLLQG
jgi:preprotein translocase subunit SecE